MTPAERSREFMMRLARTPVICCGCICLSDEDEARAKRVFRITRAVERAWRKETRAVAGT